MSRRHALDPHLPQLVSRQEATTAGLTPDQIRQRVRSGEWERLRNGQYLTRNQWNENAWDETEWGENAWNESEISEFEQARRHHAFRALAAARDHAGSVIAYESAAFVHGLTVWAHPGGPVNLVVPSGFGTGIRADIRVRRLDLPDAHIHTSTTAITTPARTWMDITRRGRLADSLVTGDALLASGMVTIDDLQAMREFADRDRLPGRRRVRRAIDYLDPVRESALESASFAYFVENRIRLPRAQVNICDARGYFVARVDFLWENPRSGRTVVGEADGRLKYDSSDALYAEKRREDALRALGYHVVRWSASDLRGPALARRLLTLV